MRRKESTRHQAPSTRKAPSFKIQSERSDSHIGAWCLKFLWSLVLGAWCFRGRAVALTFLFTLPAPACRYNIREIGFVDVDQPKFRLAVFVHGDEQKDWLPLFHEAATRILRPSNVAWDVVDEVQQTDSPDLRHRAQLGPRLPGG